tara:strand:- start:225 stop:1391 length:1167 start_codon:yes stop_codon:yes gene_type:complete
MRIFTSESVSEGHPDKIADQISDAIVDALIARDPAARIACETMVKTGMVFVAGEITTQAWVDIELIVRDVIASIGYTRAEWGFDAQSCAVITSIGQQSSDIAQGVDSSQCDEQGAGDQGLVFGYATDETDSLMPAPIEYANRLMRQQSLCRRTGQLPWLGPDAKSQVTILYDDSGMPCGVDNIVLSTQHDPSIEIDQLRSAVIEDIIQPVIPSSWLTDQTQLYINPTGRFVIGGPVGDCGLTGRKIIVDTYGGMARHGGGCFSGKDPSKVDRSAAYMARYIAKNVVSAQLAKRCEVQITYAIGVSQPTSVRIETFGTGVLSDTALAQHVTSIFDLTPYGIITYLDLCRPIYQKTAVGGHFGRTDPDFRWELTDQAETLRLSVERAVMA